MIAGFLRRYHLRFRRSELSRSIRRLRCAGGPRAFLAEIDETDDVVKIRPLSASKFVVLDGDDYRVLMNTNHELPCL